MVLGHLDIHMLKNEVGPWSHIVYNINSKLTNLNMGAKTIKFLEENIGTHLPDLGFGSGFLAMTSRRTTTKEKKNWISSKSNFLVSLKNVFKKGKYNLQNRRKYLQTI